MSTVIESIVEDILERDYPLVGADEPPPVELLNPDGSACVLLVCDHASNRIPRALDHLGLDGRQLERHVAYDIGARRLTEHLSRHLDAPAVLASYSRLVIDLNRHLDDTTAIPVESDGIRVPGNHGLSREDAALRVRCFYTPYRQAIDGCLNGLRARGAVPALIAIHSFTPALAGVARPWEIGLMWDKDPRIPLPLMERLRAHPFGVRVGDNEPYSGRHAADYTIDHHAEAAGLPHVSIEVRQDLVDTPEGAERWATMLHEALREVLADPGLYRVWEAL